jgi:hypothetical protein
MLANANFAGNDFQRLGVQLESPVQRAWQSATPQYSLAVHSDQRIVNHIHIKAIRSLECVCSIRVCAGVCLTRGQVRY